MIGAHISFGPADTSLPTGKAYQVNISTYEAVETAVNEIVKDFNGRLDIFVANSGIPWTQGSALSGELDHYRKVVTTDLDGTFYSARAAGFHWKRQKKEGTTIDGKKLENYREGSFIATASMSGHIVNIPQAQAAYNAAKAGVIHLCKSSSLSQAAKNLLSYFHRQISRGGMGRIRSFKHSIAGLHGN